jgi:hypothetical protein
MATSAIAIPALTPIRDNRENARLKFLWIDRASIEVTLRKPEIKGGVNLLIEQLLLSVLIILCSYMSYYKKIQPLIYF